METNNFIPLLVPNKIMFVLKNTAQNARYVRGIFYKYVKTSDK